MIIVERLIQKSVLFFILGLFMLPLQVISQTGIIKGKVVDVKNNEAVPFANVIIQGSTIGTTTDLEGAFIISNIM